MDEDTNSVVDDAKVDDDATMEEKGMNEEEGGEEETENIREVMTNKKGNSGTHGKINLQWEKSWELMITNRVKSIGKSNQVSQPESSEDSTATVPESNQKPTQPQMGET